MTHLLERFENPLGLLFFLASGVAGEGTIFF